MDAYLKKTLPDAWEGAHHILDEVYNLKDLAARPVFLDMIVKSLPRIKDRAGDIRTADLYSIAPMWKCGWTGRTGATSSREREDNSSWRRSPNAFGRAMRIGFITKLSAM